jgi:hypothetical protein
MAEGVSGGTGAPPARSPRKLREPRRALLLDGAHLAILWTFAIAQPVLDLLGRTPEFFAVRGSARVDIIVFAVAVVVLPPAVLLALEALAALVDARLRRAIHLVFVAGLAAMVALYFLKRATHGTSSTLVPLSIALGAAGAALYARWHVARTFMNVLSPAPALFLVIFLFFSPAHRLVLGGSSHVSVAGVSSRAPVVMLIFDELPVTSLLRSPEQIDAARYPNFATLAKQSDWFINTYASAENTTYAVPAIMTGDWPRPGALPMVADHPQNIFTLFGRADRMNVRESVTRLCPSQLCRREQPSFLRRMRSLASDVKVVSLHQLLPKDLEAKLPSVTSSWQDFRRPSHPRRNILQVEQKVATAALAQDRPAGLFKVIDGAHLGQRPSLNLAHVLLPHTPWQYLPSGRQYGNAEPVPGNPDYQRWGGDRWAVLQGYQRYLLQLGFVDRLLGEALRRLRASGMYDRSLIVVTADHGVSFRPNGQRRAITRANAQDMAPVPLFIKAPHQASGRIIRTRLQTVDILPTVADILHVRLPWRVDGHSAFARGANRTRIVIYATLGNRLVFDPERLEALRRAALARQLVLFGTGRGFPGLTGAEPHSELIGHRVGEFPASPSQGARASIDQARTLRQVEPRAGFVPAHITGEIDGRLPSGTADLAVAVNGRIGATTRILRSFGHLTFSAMVPESSLHAGGNDVEVLAIASTAGGVTLASLRRVRGAPTFALGAQWIRSSDGRRLPIVPGGVRGVVDKSQVIGKTAVFSGWAASVRDRRPAESVLVFSNTRFVAAIAPRERRPDVARGFTATLERSGYRPAAARAYAAPLEQSGYSAELPLSLIQPAGTRARVQLFGVQGGVASPLPFKCSQTPQDFGCGPSG